MASKKQTVIINGKTYDVASGAQITTSSAPSPAVRVIADIAAPSRPLPRKERPVAPHAKRQVQKSTTLRRTTSLQKPVGKAPQGSAKTRKTVKQSESISKFAPVKKTSPQPARNIDQDLLAQTRALEKAHAEHLALQQQKTAAVDARVVKEHLLNQAVDRVDVVNTPHKKKHIKHILRERRFASAAMTSLALMLFGGYLTYMNIPNLSIRVAAANSGVDASLPAYQPAGYRIHGPITYRSGEVNVAYTQTGTNAGYKLTQRPTDWDPIATLDNYVEDDSKNDYQIRSVQGLTVYTYDKKAVWVNGGILHIIAGNAPLSSQQVERIVASM